MEPGFGLVGGLAFGLLSGSFGGLGFALGFGLLAFVQHFTLRFWLSQSGVFPWQAVPFLEDATTRIFLRRVGGGYSFVHRLLLDYVADLDAQTPSVGSAQMKSASGSLPS